MSKLEQKAEWILKSLGVAYEREYRFDPKRRWRIDFYIPEGEIGIEIEGGIWLGGRGGHTSGKGYNNNCEKYNAAAIRGITILRYTASMLGNIERDLRQIGVV